ncbi:MAG: hypothetical protein U0324_04520 [Polyangiales bacterium]
MELDLDDLARPLPDERARVEALAFDRSGRWLAAVAFGTLVVYDLRDGTRHAEVPLPSGRGVRSLAFSPDGRRAVVALAHDARPGDPSALAVVDLAASSIARLLPDESHREALREVTRLRESLTAWALTPSGESVVTAWGRAGLAAFPLDGSGCERKPAPFTSDDASAEVVALAFAGATLACQTTEGLARDAGGAWRSVAKDSFGRGLLAPVDDGERVVVAGHAPRRLGQVARSGAWVVRLADGATNFDGVRAEGMAPVGASHRGWRVWWARPVERFATRFTPLALHCHDVAAGTFARRVADAKKAASTCAAVDPAGERVAFGRVRSVGVFELAP